MTWWAVARALSLWSADHNGAVLMKLRCPKPLYRKPVDGFPLKWMLCFILQVQEPDYQKHEDNSD